jgi:transcriptional regulator with XRE-family HTH domain
MSGVERGVRNISLLKLHAVARALSVPARSLMPAE